MISGLVLAEIANALDINLDMKRTIGYVQFQYKSGAYCVSPAIHHRWCSELITYFC